MEVPAPLLPRATCILRGHWRLSSLAYCLTSSRGVESRHLTRKPNAGSRLPGDIMESISESGKIGALLLFLSLFFSVSPEKVTKRERERESMSGRCKCPEHTEECKAVNTDVCTSDCAERDHCIVRRKQTIVVHIITRSWLGPAASERVCDLSQEML